MAGHTHAWIGMGCVGWIHGRPSRWPSTEVRHSTTCYRLSNLEWEHGMASTPSPQPSTKPNPHTQRPDWRSVGAAHFPVSAPLAACVLPTSISTASFGRHDSAGHMVDGIHLHRRPVPRPPWRIPLGVPASVIGRLSSISALFMRGIGEPSHPTHCRTLGQQSKAAQSPSDPSCFSSLSFGEAGA